MGCYLVLTRPPEYAKAHSLPYFQHSAPWPVHLPAKHNPPSPTMFLKDWSWKSHNIWSHSAGTHQREADMEGLTAGHYGLLLLQRAKCESLARLERKFYTSKSWFSRYILLLLMLLTPEHCCSITISIITVWALLNPCCSLEVFHQNTLWSCGSAEWNTELHSLTA